MSVKSRTRKKALRQFNRRLKWNDGPDRVLGRWQLIDVHDTSLAALQAGHAYEFDFWSSNGRGVYLLRLRRAGERKLNIVSIRDRETLTCLVAEGPLDKITDEVLEQVIADFEKAGIPY